MPKVLCTYLGLDLLVEAGQPAGVASQAWALLTNSIRDGPGSGQRPRCSGLTGVSFHPPEGG